jgi:polygalacturonase
MSTSPKHSFGSRSAHLIGLLAACALLGTYVSAQTLPTLPAPPAPEPSTHINVLNPPYSAAGNGSTKDTTAFQNAINAAAATSGGAVVDVPGGHTYLIGSISLKSNVWLNVESGATIQGSNSTSDYPLVTERWEGTDTSCYQGLIAATGTATNPLTNIAIIGSGSIKSGSSIGALRGPRGPTMIEPRYCNGVFIENITVSNIKMWTVHPTYCHDVTISGMIVKSQQVNSDGLDPDSCSRVLIEGCNFTSGDDDIAIKSGKGTQGATDNIPCQDITIENCTFASAGGDSGTIAFGSELSGGIQRVLIENNAAGPSRAELYLKTTEGRGGYVSDVTVDHLTSVPTQVVEFNTDYVAGSNVSPGITSFNNISISNVTVKSSTDVAKITGDAKEPLNNISLSGFTGSAGSGITVTNATNFSSSGISVSGGSGLSESNVTAGVTASPAEASVSPGGSATFAVNVPSGLSGTVSLKMGGDGIDTNLPAGASASFSPSSLGGSGSSTLTIKTSSSTPVGTYALIILASNGSTTHTAAVTLTVGSGGPSAAADPVFSPGGGTYTTAQNVTITSATGTASIRYTTDGSTPSETNGALYSNTPVTVATGPTKLQAIAYAAGFTDSNVTSATYTINSPTQVIAPVFSPGGGTYGTAQNVTISTATSGAIIHYTTDGSTPTETNGTAYSAGTAVDISSTTTLQAIAFETGFTDSTVTSATYNIGSPQTFNFEAASMSPVGTGATVSTSNDPNVTGGLLEFLNSTAVGQSITLTTPVIPAGTYQVQFRYKTNTSRAQHNVVIDGSQVGGTIDQYATTSTYPTATLGTVTFASAATHTIVLTVTGKDSAATHFYICADKFTFVGQ